MQTAHSYADDGQQVAESFTIEGRMYGFARGYDSANRTNSHTFADGNQFQWVYDARNMVTEVQYDGDQVLTQGHDSGYRLTSQTFGNNLACSLTYNRDDNLHSNDKVTGIAVEFCDHGCLPPGTDVGIIHPWVDPSDGIDSSNVVDDFFENNPELFWLDEAIPPLTYGIMGS